MRILSLSKDASPYFLRRYVTSFIGNPGYPAIMLIILSLVIAFVEALGRQANLIRWSMLFFWALLGYRLIISLLYTVFGRNQVRPYQRQILTPIFWLLVSLWVLNTFINLFSLADVELFHPVYRKQIYAGAIFLAGAGPLLFVYL